MELLCPRCGGSFDGQEFYGVCATCATALRERFAGGPRTVETTEYEPKMNVTPNAVASKE